MEVIVFANEAYQKLKEALLKEVKTAISEANERALFINQPEKDWITTENAKSLLGIKSRGKLQQLRNDGLIRFSQHGRIIKYSKKSILSFLEQHLK